MINNYNGTIYRLKSLCVSPSLLRGMMHQRWAQWTVLTGVRTTTSSGSSRKGVHHSTTTLLICQPARREESILCRRDRTDMTA